MKKLLLTLLLALGMASVHAQIPAEVTTVMDKCRQTFANANGLEYTMDMKTKLGPISIMDMHFVIANKGEMSRTKMTVKVLDEEVATESGFDGKEAWEIKHSKGHDTIVFSQKKKDDGVSELNLNLDKEYRTAKMKNKGDYYEITFSDPVDKKSEAKKITVKISTKTYHLIEMKTSARGANVVMTFNKYRIGLKDDYFKVNLSQYPKAVVIRK
ncbi:MAG: hypothetical protein J6X88_01570 [Bacteroidales bacterium]|nr:hypothetical protein [Bacteroidales bacterium]